MIVIHNRILPFGRYNAINLFGVVFVKGQFSKTTDRHEAIHTAQMKEMLYIFFYLWYIIEWILKAIKYRSLYRGYRAICFEREAYFHESEKEYLKRRAHYNFVKFL